MDDYVASNWTGLITCKNTWQSPRLRNKPPYVSSTLLSKQTRINRQQYALWIDQEKLKGCIRETANGRQRILIAAGQEELIDHLSRQRTLQQTSRQLGLPENRVRELIAAELLTGYRSNAGGPWHIDPASVQQMMDQLRAMGLCSPPKSGGLTMDCILRHRMDSAVSFSKLIIALRDGVVPFSMAVDTEALNQLLIDKAAFDRWLTQQQVGITIPDLALRLHIKQEVAYHLINKRIIPSARKGRSGCHVSEQAIEEFTHTYCFVRELAMQWYCSPRKAIAQLRQLGAEPVVGKDIDGCRQYLYRWTDIAAVSPLRH